VDGTQAEYVRTPFADTSLYKVPEGLSDEQVLFLADILPTGFEIGVLNGGVKPGDTVVVVGAGPVGLAAIITAKLYGPGRIVAVDLDNSRLERAQEFGADVVINNSSENAVERVQEMTDGLGADVVMEAVGVPATFELCTELVCPGGRVANIGLHGEPATLHLETLWIKSITITTGLVDAYSTLTLLNLVSEGRLDPTGLTTHRFELNEIMEAYDVFADAANTNAIKVTLSS
jgi:alcohol dehydrogenase